MTVLVTGATGFIGRFLCDRLLNDGVPVRGTLLPGEDAACLVQGVEPMQVEPLDTDTQWSHALSGVETVIHLAGRVHVMNDPHPDPLSEFRRTNVAGTDRLAREAARGGVRRFVFISSIKAIGEGQAAPFTAESTPSPSDPYGVSKWEAEQALRRAEAETGLEVVVLRPALVYGPGVSANFFNMMNKISKRIPLPLSLVANKRSLVYVRNLTDALALCAFHPEAAGKTYLVSDGEDVSTPELLRRTAAAMQVPLTLFPFPTTLLQLSGRLTGKTAAVHRLTASLTVDSSKIRNELGWKPPYTMEEGLAETAEWFSRR